MPYKDKTGPSGLGPLTGRGLGKCNKDVKVDDEVLTTSEKVIKKILG